MQATQQPQSRRPPRAATRRFYSLCIGQNTQKASQRQNSPRQRRDVNTSKPITNVTRKIRTPARKNAGAKDHITHSKGRAARRGPRSLDEGRHSSRQEEGEIGGGARSSETGGSRDVKPYSVGLSSTPKTNEEETDGMDQESCSSSLTTPFGSLRSQSHDRKEESGSMRGAESACGITSPSMVVDVLGYPPPPSPLVTDCDVMTHSKYQRAAESKGRKTTNTTSNASSTEVLYTSGGPRQRKNSNPRTSTTTPNLMMNNHRRLIHLDLHVSPPDTRQSTRRRPLQASLIPTLNCEEGISDSESSHTSSRENPPCSKEHLPRTQVAPFSSTAPTVINSSANLPVRSTTNPTDHLRGGPIHLPDNSHLSPTRHEEAASSPASVRVLERPSPLPPAIPVAGGEGVGDAVGGEKPSQLLQLPQLLHLLLNKQVNPSLLGAHPALSSASLVGQSNSDANNTAPGGGVSMTDVAAQLARNLVSHQSPPGRAGGLLSPLATRAGGGGDHSHPCPPRCPTNPLCSSTTTSWPPSPYSSSPPSQQSLLIGPRDAEPFNPTSYHHKGCRGGCPQSGLRPNSDTTHIPRSDEISSLSVSSSPATLPEQILVESTVSARTTSHQKPADLLVPLVSRPSHSTLDGSAQKRRGSETITFPTDPGQSTNGAAATLARLGDASPLPLSALNTSRRQLQSERPSTCPLERKFTTSSTGPGPSAHQSDGEEDSFSSRAAEQHRKDSLVRQQPELSFQEEKQLLKGTPGGGWITTDPIGGEQISHPAYGDQTGAGNKESPPAFRGHLSTESNVTPERLQSSLHVSQSPLVAKSSDKPFSPQVHSTDSKAHRERTKTEESGRDDEAAPIAPAHHTVKSTVTTRSEMAARPIGRAAPSSGVNTVAENSSGAGDPGQAGFLESKDTQDATCSVDRSDGFHQEQDKKRKKEVADVLGGGTVQRNELIEDQQNSRPQRTAETETGCGRQESREPRNLPVSEFLKNHYQGPELPSHPSAAMSFGTSSESEGEISNEKGGGGGWPKKKRKERRVSLGASDALWQPHFHPHNQEFRVRYRYKGSMRLKTISCARFGREGAKRLTAAFVERWRLSGRFVAAKTHRSRLALVDLPQDTQLLPSYDKKRAPSPLTSSSLLFQLSQSPSIFSLSSTFLGQSPPFPPLNPAAAAASASCAPPPRPGLFLGGSRVAPFHAWPCKPGSALWGGDDICESSNGGVGTSGAQPLVSNGGSGAFFDICTLTQGGFRAGGVEQATAAALLEAKRNGLFRGAVPAGPALSSCLPGNLNQNTLGPSPRTSSSFSPAPSRSSSICPTPPHIPLPHTLVSAPEGRPRASPGAIPSPLFASATSSTHSRPASGGEGPSGLVTPLDQSSTQMATGSSSPSPAIIHHVPPPLPCPTLAALLNPLLPACKRPRASARAPEASERAPLGTPTGSFGVHQQAILQRLHQQTQFLGKGAEPTATIALEHSGARPTAIELLPFLQQQSQVRHAADVTKEDDRHTGRHIPNTLVRAAQPTCPSGGIPERETIGSQPPQFTHQNWQGANSCSRGSPPEIRHHQLLLPGRGWNREDSHSFLRKTLDSSSSPSVTMEISKAGQPDSGCRPAESPGEPFESRPKVATGIAAGLQIANSLDHAGNDSTRAAHDQVNGSVPDAAETIHERHRRHSSDIAVSTSPRLPRARTMAENLCEEGGRSPSPRCHESNETCLPRSRHDNGWGGGEDFHRIASGEDGSLKNGHADLPCAGGAVQRQNGICTTVAPSSPAEPVQIFLRNPTLASRVGFLESHEGSKPPAQPIPGTANHQQPPIPPQSRSYWQGHAPTLRTHWNAGWPNGIDLSGGTQHFSDIAIPVGTSSGSHPPEAEPADYQGNNGDSSYPLISPSIVQARSSQELHKPARADIEEQPSLCRARLTRGREQDRASTSASPFPEAGRKELQGSNDVSGLAITKQGGSSNSKVETGSYSGMSAGSALHDFQDSPAVEARRNEEFTGASRTTAGCTSQLPEKDGFDAHDSAEDAVSTICYADEGTLCEEDATQNSARSKIAPLDSLQRSETDEGAPASRRQAAAEKNSTEALSSFLNASHRGSERPKSPRQDSPARPSRATTVREATASSSST